MQSVLFDYVMDRHGCFPKSSPHVPYFLWKIEHLRLLSVLLALFVKIFGSSNTFYLTMYSVVFLLVLRERILGR